METFDFLAGSAKEMDDFRVLKEILDGQFVRHIGTYNDSVSRPPHWFYTVLMPRYLDLLRARHRRRTVLKHEWHELGWKGRDSVSWNSLIRAIRDSIPSFIREQRQPGANV